ncbi:MAG: response regulator transcription factor [Alphaproteobacteria bacterium]
MSRDRKLLIVDSDTEFRRQLAEQLRLHAEFVAEQAGAGSEALDLIKHDYFDAAVIEAALPDMDGPELCRLMRRESFGGPIIMISGGDSGADEILALDAGANDYVTKPIRTGVLLARLRAQMRPSAETQDPVLPIGPIRFRPGSNQIFDPRSRQKIRLTQKETAILRFLYRAGNQRVSWDGLLHELRRYSARITPQNLRDHVDHLREKIEEDPARAKLLIVESDGPRLVR